MIKLNLGCGPCHLPTEEGWKNTDIRTDAGFEVEEHWDFLERIPLEDNSVDFILAWHILEHAGLTGRTDMLNDWHRILKPGGKLAIAVPDILTIFEMYKRGEFDDPWYIFMVNLYGPWNGSVGDLHKWGYCRQELDKVLLEIGFSDIKPLGPTNLPGEIERFTKSEDDEKPPLVVLADWAAQAICTK